MAIIAKLFIDDIGALSEGFNVNECSFGIEQSFDSVGKPSGRPMGGKINITLDSLMDSVGLFEWAVNESDYRSGRIEFMNEVPEMDVVAGSGEKTTLHFNNAACVRFFNTFVSNGSSKIYLTLVARSIKLDDVLYKNLWPENA